MPRKELIPIDPKHKDRVAQLQAMRDKHKGKQPGQFTQAERNEWVELKMMEEI